MKHGLSLYCVHTKKAKRTADVVYAQQQLVLAVFITMKYNIYTHVYVEVHGITTELHYKQ